MSTCSQTSPFGASGRRWIVFGDRRRIAVRDAVLAQVSRAETRGDDLQSAAFRQRAQRRRRAAALTAAAAARCDRARAIADLCTHGALVAAGRALPFGAREALPRRLTARPLRGTELEEARLRACIEIHLQCVVVGPRDVQAPGLAREAADAERFALQPGRVIRCQVPLVRDAPSLGVQRQALEIALARRRHAMPPVLGDDRHPVAREVDGRRTARRLRRRGGTLRDGDLACADCGDERGDEGYRSLHWPPPALRSL